MTTTKFLSDAQLEDMAAGLLGRYESLFGAVTSPPVPVERILEDVLDLRILWNSIPEPPGQSILAALEPATKTVVFNESSRALIDETQGLYNTVLAHEAGHWEAHVDHGQLAQRSLPDFDGSLPNLQSLDLSGNQLSGEIPPQLGSLSNLDWLDLGFNQLSGGIPPELGSLFNLLLLHLSENRLMGPSV